METIAQTIEKRILKAIEKRAIQKGMEQGMQQEKIEIAKNMLNKGIAINIIQEVTNLSKQTIENLIPR